MGRMIDINAQYAVIQIAAIFNGQFPLPTA